VTIHGKWNFYGELMPYANKILCLDEIAPGHDFLVIEGRSGLAYEQQVGGLSCIHPNVEGWFVNLGLPTSKMENFARRTCKVGCHGGPLTEDLSDDPIWEEVNKDIGWAQKKLKVKFDPERMHQGMECFIPVKVFWKEHVFNGWLMMAGNCD